MKIELGDSAKPKPTPDGFSSWVENGVIYAAETVDADKFGQHDYDNGGYEKGIRNCACGCFMGSFSSSGPVDPFGPCPKKPL